MDMILDYHRATDKILAMTGMGDKAMHACAGLAIYTIAQSIVVRRGATLYALLAVVLIEGVNEVLDRAFWGSWRWSDTSLDFLATAFWPTMLFIMSKYRRIRWDRFTSARRAAQKMMRESVAPHWHPARSAGHPDQAIALGNIAFIGSARYLKTHQQADSHS